MYLSVCCFCLSLSVLLFLSFSLTHCLFSFISFTSCAGLCHPLSHTLFLAFDCIFLSIPRPDSCLPLMPLVCSSPPLFKALTLPLFLLSLFLSPCESPDIHVEIFSHVRYRFTTPARSLWPLNLIPFTKPHCFSVCVWARLLCVTVGKYVRGCVFMHYKVEVGDF